MKLKKNSLKLPAEKNVAVWLSVLAELKGTTRLFVFIEKKDAGGYVTHDQYDKELCKLIVAIFD